MKHETPLGGSHENYRSPSRRHLQIARRMIELSCAHGWLAASQKKRFPKNY